MLNKTITKKSAEIALNTHKVYWADHYGLKGYKQSWTNEVEILKIKNAIEGSQLLMGNCKIFSKKKF